MKIRLKIQIISRKMLRLIRILNKNKKTKRSEALRWSEKTSQVMLRKRIRLLSNKTLRSWATKPRAYHNRPENINLTKTKRGMPNSSWDRSSSNSSSWHLSSSKKRPRRQLISSREGFSSPGIWFHSSFRDLTSHLLIHRNSAYWSTSWRGPMVSQICTQVPSGSSRPKICSPPSSLSGTWSRVTWDLIKSRSSPLSATRE